MKDTNPEILPVALLAAYREAFDISLIKKFEGLKDSELSANNFSFYTSVSAVFSSKIEGEDIELDSYLKHKKLGVKFLPDHTQKIDDLYDAFLLAKDHDLKEANVYRAHELITQHILQKQQRGKIRSGMMYVMTEDGKIEYVACAPANVERGMTKLFRDIETLLHAELSFEEVFYFASAIHLVFVKIHPFDDGNGRVARLLEKWFMARKLGPKVWYLQSEKLYYDRHSTYYKNIRLLGLEYDLLDYTQALPFLSMLPQALA